MPLHTLPLSRRSFLAQSAGVVAGLTVVRHGWGDEGSKTNPNLLALLSDTHIPDSPDVTARDVNMTANLRQVIGEVIALETRPAGVIVNGDCAYLKGQPADYANFAKCVAPLDGAGLPLYVTMGNHDDRAPLYNALQLQQPARPLVASRHITVIETPRANWILLDSLTKTNVVTGALGAEQLKWLDKALAERTDKPTLVMAHHNPQFEAPASGPWTGIEDTAELLELLGRHKQVKAFVFGHSHNWAISRRGDLHLVNLPPVAYVFSPEKPNGWVRSEVLDDGLSLELRTIDPKHKQNGEKVKLTWA